MKLLALRNSGVWSQLLLPFPSGVCIHLLPDLHAAYRWTSLLSVSLLMNSDNSLCERLADGTKTSLDPVRKLLFDLALKTSYGLVWKISYDLVGKRINILVTRLSLLFNTYLHHGSRIQNRVTRPQEPTPQIVSALRRGRAHPLEASALNYHIVFINNRHV